MCSNEIVFNSFQVLVNVEKIIWALKEFVIDIFFVVDVAMCDNYNYNYNLIIFSQSKPFS